MNIWLHRIAFAGYAALTAWLSLTPSTGGGALWDKPLHLACYTIFVLLGTPLCRSRAQLYWLGAAVFAYSGLMEVAQHFVPGRSLSAADMVANGLGVALGVWLARSRLRAAPTGAPPARIDGARRRILG